MKNKDHYYMPSVGRAIAVFMGTSVFGLISGIVWHRGEGIGAWLCGWIMPAVMLVSLDPICLYLFPFIFVILLTVLWWVLPCRGTFVTICVTSAVWHIYITHLVWAIAISM